MVTRVSAAAALPFLCAAAVSLDHGLLSEPSTFSGPPEPAAVAPSCPSPKSNHFGTFNPNTAQWRLHRKRPGWVESASGDITFVFGNPNDTPLIGDWDGNGSQTQGAWRAGTFFLSNTLGGAATVSVTIGGTPYVPVVGDWDGNNTTTIGTFKNGVWRIRNANTASAPETVINFGQAGDIPVTGDWNGDYIHTIGVYRPSVEAFYLRNTNTSGPEDLLLNYGLEGDMPIVGDWDGDGVTTIGMKRGTSWQLRDSNLEGFPDIVFDFGGSADQPLAGNWASSDPAYSTVPPAMTNFFPLAVDYVRGPSFAGWKSRGINTVIRVPDLTGYPSPDSIEAWTDAANSQGLRMIREPRHHPNNDDMEPGLLAWFINDEPEMAVPPVLASSLQQIYDTLKPHNTPRPIFFTSAGLRVWRSDGCNGPGDASNENCYPEYIQAEDWVSSDLYPINHWDSADSLFRIGSTLDKLRRWSQSKVQFAYLEATAQFPEAPGRIPTPDEMRAEIWTVIINGARGIAYFVVSGCTGGVCKIPDGVPASLKAEMQAQHARITPALATALQKQINPPPIGMAAPTPLEATWRISGGQRYFFVLNLSSGSVTRTMKLCGAVPSAPITVVGENRTVGGAGSSSFSDSFGPYVVHIYRF